MSKTADSVTALVKPEIERLGYELWDVEFLREGGNWVLRVIIDKRGGISTDDCETVSRAIDPLLDEADPIEQSYMLEVSSAGLERVLKRPGDFERFTGSMVEIKLFAPIEKSREFTGILKKFENQVLFLEDGKEFAIKDIAQVKLKYCEETGEVGKK